MSVSCVSVRVVQNASALPSFNLSCARPRRAHVTEPQAKPLAKRFVERIATHAFYGAAALHPTDRREGIGIGHMQLLARSGKARNAEPRDAAQTPGSVRRASRMPGSFRSSIGGLLSGCLRKCDLRFSATLDRQD